LSWIAEERSYSITHKNLGGYDTLVARFFSICILIGQQRVIKEF